MQHSLQCCWCLGFIRTDDEQRKEDREQATTKTNHRNHIIIFCYIVSTKKKNKKECLGFLQEKEKQYLAFWLRLAKYNCIHHLISLRIFISVIFLKGH